MSIPEVGLGDTWVQASVVRIGSRSARRGLNRSYDGYRPRWLSTSQFRKFLNEKNLL